MSKVFVTRFAPSPTGLLHLGHAYSALLAFNAAKENGGKFLLRVEDIDRARCRPVFEAAICEDLQWLEISWETPVRRQSDHFDDYGAALGKLRGMGVLYPCFCTRQDIAREIEESGHAPHGPAGAVYPGACRKLSAAERERRMQTGVPFAWRLDAAGAVHHLNGQALAFTEAGRGAIAVEPMLQGDVVLARKDVPASYHLAVVVDDHLQGITIVIRGQDLFHATHIQRLLQALLGFGAPEYRHHPLLTGADGKRFAKRDRALTLRALREGGTGPDELPALFARHGG